MLYSCTYCVFTLYSRSVQLYLNFCFITKHRGIPYCSKAPNHVALLLLQSISDAKSQNLYFPCFHWDTHGSLCADDRPLSFLKPKVMLPCLYWEYIKCTQASGCISLSTSRTWAPMWLRETMYASIKHDKTDAWKDYWRLGQRPEKMVMSLFGFEM